MSRRSFLLPPGSLLLVGLSCNIPTNSIQDSRLWSYRLSSQMEPPLGSSPHRTRSSYSSGLSQFRLSAVNDPRPLVLLALNSSDQSTSSTSFQVKFKSPFTHEDIPNNSLGLSTFLISYMVSFMLYKKTVLKTHGEWSHRERLPTKQPIRRFL